jgi:hypothetical protein
MESAQARARRGGAKDIMYERRGQPLLDRPEFLRRLTRHVLLAAGALAVAWGIGILGYRTFVGLPWLDAVLNAAMILGGMGPVDPVLSAPGKLFAAFYALFAGVVFLAAMGVIAAPLLHRILHHFHLGLDELDDGEGRSRPLTGTGSRHPRT